MIPSSLKQAAISLDQSRKWVLDFLLNLVKFIKPSPVTGFHGMTEFGVPYVGILQSRMSLPGSTELF